MQDERPVRLGDGILNMRPYCAKSSSGTPRSLDYELTGVVDHAGGMGSGHYMARCKAATGGRWFRANDSTIVEASTFKHLEMAGTVPYMLVYHLKA